MEELAAYTPDRQPPAERVRAETLRCAIWAAANIDRLARRYIPERRADGAHYPASVTAFHASALLHELAQLRTMLAGYVAGHRKLPTGAAIESP